MTNETNYFRFKLVDDAVAVQLWHLCACKRAESLKVISSYFLFESKFMGICIIKSMDSDVVERMMKVYCLDASFTLVFRSFSTLRHHFNLYICTLKLRMGELFVVEKLKCVFYFIVGG